MKKSFTAQAALLLCDEHQNEEMDMYCKRCKKPACSECFKTDHFGHEFETIAKFSRKLIKNRDGFLNDLRSTFAGKQRRKDRVVRETKCRNETLLKKKLGSLEKRRDEMHQAVDKLIDKQKAECKSYSDKMSRGVQNLEKKVQEEEDEIMKMLNIFEKTTTKGLDIIEYYEKLCSRVNDLELPSLSEHYDRQVHQEGEIKNDELKQMIGEVTVISSIPKVIGNKTSFTHKNAIASVTIRPISSEQAWIAYKDEDDIVLMQKNGACIQSVKHHTDVNSFIVTKDNYFVNVDFRKQTILKMDQSGKRSVIMNTAPMRPVSVGEALDGNILVSLVDELSGTRTAQSQRKVQMVTPGGQVLHTYEFGGDGSTPVFTTPGRPTQNYNSNVCIIDIYEIGEDRYRGKVLVFYEDGELKFIYKGRDGEFNPQDICCDSLCNILCINYRDDSVHIIDSEGTFLAYLLTSDTCVADPYSLGVHRDALWVGSEYGEVALYRYKY